MPFIRSFFVTVLTWEARLVLHKYHPRVIAVTGNLGKTTTKDAIFAVLSQHLHVRKSRSEEHTSELQSH